MMRLALSGTLLVMACSRAEKPAPEADSLGNVVVAADTATAPRLDTVASPRALPVTTKPAGPTPDTARGIVRRVGADPNSRLVLITTANGGATLALAGLQLSELAAAEGLEVMISGARTAERAMDASPTGALIFQVNQFVVRAADGVEAHDGVLVSRDGRVYLETAPNVRALIVALPVALQDQIGARVFLVGPLSRAPQAFGVLRRRS